MLEKQLVWGEGSASSKIAFIGERPAVEEMKTGRPFTGTAGKYFDACLHDVGLSRAEVFITNVVKYGNPSDPTEKPSKAETAEQLPHLLKELSCLTELRLVVVFGEYVLNSLLNLQHVGNWRGYVERPLNGALPTLPYLITYHPSGVNRSMGALRPYFISDLRKAREIVNDPAILNIHESFDYNPSEETIRDFVREAKHRGVYALDIEMPEKDSGIDDDVYTLPDKASKINVVGLSHTVGEVIGISEEQLKLIEPLTADENVTCVIFNHLFDTFHVGTHIRFNNKFFDPMLAMYFLYPQARPKNLNMAGSLWWVGDRWKQLQSSDITTYNARDTYRLLPIYYRQLAELKSNGMLELYNTAGIQLSQAVEEWRKTGVRSDGSLAVVKELLQRKKIDMYENIWRDAFPSTLWSSPKQVGELLYDVLHMPEQYNMKENKETKHKQRTRTTDDEALETLSKLRPDSQIPALLLALRKSKHASDLFNKISPDGRCHPKTLIHRSESGRLAQVDPNLMNITEDDRDVFLPDCERCEWLHVDFSQIELWLTAWYAQCESLLRTKEAGIYIHGVTYEDMFHRPFFEVGKPKQKRYRLNNIPAQELLIAKSFPHGVSYGEGVDTIAGKFNISRDQARDYLNKYLADKPEIPRYHRQIETDIWQRGVLRTAFNRIRRFTIIQRNEALSFKPQSTALDILIQNAILPLPSLLRDYTCDCGSNHPARVILAIHDSVEVNCPVKHRDDVVKTVLQQMRKPIPQLVSPLTPQGLWIDAEAAVGRNWKDVKTIDA